MEVDGWDHVSLGICCVSGKLFQNSPKPVLIFPIYMLDLYTMCILFVGLDPMHCKKLLVPQKNTLMKLS